MVDLHLSMGYKCNNNCLYCINSDIENKILDEFYELDYSYLEKKIAETKNQKIDNLVLTGGEPTIMKNFFKVLKLAKELNLNISLQTNGRAFCSRNFTRRVRDIVPNISFNVHIDSVDPNLFDKITCIKGSTKQVLSGIDNLREITKNIGAVIVLTKLNYKDLPDTVKRLSEKDLRKICVQYTIPTKYIVEKELMPRFYEIKKPIEEAINIAKLNKAEITFSEIPLCYIKDFRKHCFELDLLKNGVDKKTILSANGMKTSFKEGMQKNKAKPLKCKLCKNYNLCEGMWKNYLDLYGEEEFNPIKIKL